MGNMQQINIRYTVSEEYHTSKPILFKTLST